MSYLRFYDSDFKEIGRVPTEIAEAPTLMGVRIKSDSGTNFEFEGFYSTAKPEGYAPVKPEDQNALEKARMDLIKKSSELMGTQIQLDEARKVCDELTRRLETTRIELSDTKKQYEDAYCLGPYIQFGPDGTIRYKAEKDSFESLCYAREQLSEDDFPINYVSEITDVLLSLAKPKTLDVIYEKIRVKRLRDEALSRLQNYDEDEDITAFFREVTLPGEQAEQLLNSMVSDYEQLQNADTPENSVWDVVTDAAIANIRKWAAYLAWKKPSISPGKEISENSRDRGPETTVPETVHAAVRPFPVKSNDVPETAVPAAEDASGTDTAGCRADAVEPAQELLTEEEAEKAEAPDEKRDEINDRMKAGNALQTEIFSNGGGFNNPTIYRYLCERTTNSQSFLDNARNTIIEHFYRNRKDDTPDRYAWKSAVNLFIEEQITTEAFVQWLKQKNAT